MGWGRKCLVPVKCFREILKLQIHVLHFYHYQRDLNGISSGIERLKTQRAPAIRPNLIIVPVISHHSASSQFLYMPIITYKYMLFITCAGCWLSPVPVILCASYQLSNLQIISYHIRRLSPVPVVVYHLAGYRLSYGPVIICGIISYHPAGSRCYPPAGYWSYHPAGSRCYHPSS